MNHLAEPIMCDHGIELEARCWKCERAYVRKLREVYVEDRREFTGYSISEFRKEVTR